MKRIAILRRTTIAAAATTAAFANDFDRTGWPESLTVGTGSQGATQFGYGSA